MKDIWNLDYKIILDLMDIKIEKRYIKENFKFCEYCEEFTYCYEISNSEDNLLFFVCRECLE